MLLRRRHAANGSNLDLAVVPDFVAVTANLSSNIRESHLRVLWAVLKRE
jgi:hypothetical protein